MPEDRERREVAILATLGLIGCTVGAVGGVAYGVIVNDGDAAVLGTIGSLGVGALATLAGARASRKDDPSARDGDAPQ